MYRIFVRVFQVYSSIINITNITIKYTHECNHTIVFAYLFHTRRLPLELVSNYTMF